MSEWLGFRDTFLNVILQREAPPLRMICTKCPQTLSWRCHDCFGEPAFCKGCLVQTHANLPFHRVSEWDGHTFYRSSLSNAGGILHVGHRGHPCPSYQNSLFEEPTAQPDVISDNNTSSNLFTTLTPWEKAGIELKTMAAPQDLDSDGNPYLTVVDTTGIHQIRAQYCRCPESSRIPEYQQLLQLGLYPASITQPRTVFTFRVLNDYDLLNLETKSTPQRYLAMLQRLTTDIFPDTLPDRYRELLRVIRQWRNLNQRKNAGVAYSTPSNIPPGGLALFCPACPQPGVNLPDGWKNDPNP